MDQRSEDESRLPGTRAKEPWVLEAVIRAGHRPELFPGGEAPSAQGGPLSFRCLLEAVPGV